MIVADINWEGVGYLTGTFLVPFLIVWIISKKWYLGVLAGIVWIFFKASQVSHVAI